MDLKDNRNAIKYFTEAINYFESQERSVEIENKLCENYLNLGKAFQMQKIIPKRKNNIKRVQQFVIKSGINREYRLPIEIWGTCTSFNERILWRK